MGFGHPQVQPPVGAGVDAGLPDLGHGVAPGSRCPIGPSVRAPQRRQTAIRPLVSGKWCSSSRAPNCDASGEAMISPHLAARLSPTAGPQGPE